MRFVALGLATVALVAAGCGAADKNAYVKQVNKAEQALTSSLTAMSSGTDPATLDKGGAAIEAAAADFGKITPPDDAKHAHGEIIDGLHKLAGTMHDAADAARAKDLDKLNQILQGFQSSAGARELQAAQDELKAHGYKFASS
jgi:hypothetical protein